MLDAEQIRQALAGQPTQRLELGSLRPAAVLLPLFLKEGEDHLLFTRRTDHLNHHRGEISFPGGGRHGEDPDLLATALRESEEEMGIRPADVEVLGRLSDFFSIHGYHVVPFVGRIAYPYPFRANPDEIAEVIELPLRRLLDPAIFRKEHWTHQGRVHPVCFYTLERHEIWGLTAAILRQFLKLTFPGRH